MIDLKENQIIYRLFTFYLRALSSLMKNSEMVQKWQTKLRLNNLMQTILLRHCTVQKMKFSIKNFLSKCNQICSFLRIWSRLLKRSSMKNFFVQCWFNRIDRKAVTFKKILVGVLLELISQKHQNHLHKFHKQCSTPSDIVNRLQLLIVNSASSSTV